MLITIIAVAAALLFSRYFDGRRKGGDAAE